ncbi:MAG TPA: anthranilate phosphoribosyltransferase [Candidatus Dormibacteraeota bacterium]|nr:anthranilate phosphoribosyltransferase [Candidatus Dormibacteraeota bacterium]
MGDSIVRDALATVVEQRDLDVDRARAVMDAVMEGAATPAQIGALLVALRVKGESVDELTGFVQSMRDHVTHVELDADAVDTCGTGGDGLHTFNVSTSTALVAAGAGCTVAKHGNRSASSRCGSADVLEALGVTITLDADGVRRCVREAGLGFMFAPLFHPAMKHAAGPRRELGVRTVFNVIGPLANPAGVRRQLLGVPEAGLAAKMADVLRRLGHEHALVVTGTDGIDELALNGPATVHEVRDGTVRTTTLDPLDLGFQRSGLEAIRGGDPSDNARIVHEVLDGGHGPARDVVVLNTAAVLCVAGKTETVADGLQPARESIDSGAARDCLDRLIRASTAAAA